MNKVNWEDIPEVIGKVDFCKICKVSPRTALFLLKSGLVPCETSGKKTRCYKIKKSDVQEYLSKREVFPEYYKPPFGWYSESYEELYKFSVAPDLSIEKLQKFWIEVFRPYDDVLKPKEITQITGYRKSTINEWCASGQISRSPYIQES